MPAEEVVDYCEAAIRVFDRHGNRSNIYRARLKFLIKDLGFADFKKLFDTELAAVRADNTRKVPAIDWESSPPDKGGVEGGSLTRGNRRGGSPPH